MKIPKKFKLKISDTPNPEKILTRISGFEKPNMLLVSLKGEYVLQINIDDGTYSFFSYGE